MSESDLAFPTHLARQLAEVWRTLPEAAAAALPVGPVLEEILASAYVASLETEEGRPTTFTLCCFADAASEASGEVERWPFSAERPYTVQELRRLSAATHLDSAAIWVRFSPEGPPRIAGLLNIGSSWGSAFGARPGMPGGLVLRVEGAGRLGVYHQDAVVLTLAGGRLRHMHHSMEPFSNGHPLLLQAREHFGGRLAAAGAPLDASAAELLDSTYVTLLVTMLGGIQRLGSGGTLILASPGSVALAGDRAVLKAKYTLEPTASFLAENYVAMLLARLSLEALIGKGRDWRQLRHGLPESGTEMQRLYLLGLEVRTARQRLIDEAAFVASLSGTDGATILTTELLPRGFGAEIAADPLAPPPVYEVLEHSEGSVRALDTEQFGMRHRSAMRLVATAPDAVAFVVSQDGGTSMIYAKDGRVYFRRDMPLLRVVV